jgi:hypothetical protein
MNDTSTGGQAHRRSTGELHHIWSACSAGHRIHPLHLPGTSVDRHLARRARRLQPRQSPQPWHCIEFPSAGAGRGPEQPHLRSTRPRLQRPSPGPQPAGARHRRRGQLSRALREAEATLNLEVLAEADRNERLTQVVVENETTIRHKAMVLSISQPDLNQAAVTRVMQRVMRLPIEPSCRPPAATTRELTQALMSPACPARAPAPCCARPAP